MRTSGKWKTTKREREKVYLEWDGWVVEVINEDFPLRGAHHEDGEAGVHRITPLREVDREYGLALAGVPVLDRRRKERKKKMKRKK